MTIEGEAMRIEAWTPTFKPIEQTPLVPVLIALPECPWHCNCKEIMMAMWPLLEKFYIWIMLLEIKQGVAWQGLEFSWVLQKKDLNMYGLGMMRKI